MILSASRRTDIPACYSEWFFNRIKEGFLLVRNPMNRRQVSRISLSPDLVDGIVFWSKNPAPMLSHLDRLKNYTYYFQFTLTPYGPELEGGLPSKEDVIIPAFLKLSDAIGPKRVIWRYDPVILSTAYPISYHIEHFAALARRLSGHTCQVIISFLDLYRDTVRNLGGIKPDPITAEDMRSLACSFASIAREHHLTISTCCESVDLSGFGIRHASCIDKKLLESLCGCSLSVSKDSYQRAECGCASSIDIGAYNTCVNGCRYCYANYSKSLLEKNLKEYDPEALLLCSSLGEEDRVIDRKMKSYKDGQMRLPFLE